MNSRVIEEDLENVYSRRIPWEFMENKTILITGAYGMLASYMVYMLMYLNEKKGMHINVIALGRSKDKFEERFGSAGKYKYLKFYVSDLSDGKFPDVKIDYIIHAASLASPQYYKVCPIEVILPNIIGNYHLLELASRNDVKGYLLFSTGDIYGRVKGVNRISETDYGVMDTLDIHNCYSESKRMAETMCRAWMQEKNVEMKIARIWHTYAPTMDIKSDPRVFASFVKDIIYKRDIVMLSDGTAKRSFCYIADAIAGYFTILLCGQGGEAYNVCNTREFYSIGELAEILVTLYPERNLRVIRRDREQNDSYVENSVANHIPPDMGKLEQLGWRAQYTVYDGFKRVIESLETGKTGDSNEKNKYLDSCI